MKYMFRKVPLLLSAVLAVTSSSTHAISSDEIDYYFGLDAMMSTIKVHPQWVPFIRSKYGGANVSFGLRPSKYFSVELGYSGSIRKSKSLTIDNGATFNGMLNNSGQSINVQGRQQVVSSNVDLNVYLPIMESFEANLFVGPGWTRVKPTFIVPVAGTNLDTLKSLRSKTRSYARAGIGFQGMLTEVMGVRLRVMYKGTSRVKFRNFIGPNTAPERPIGRTISTALGVYWYL